MAKKTTQKVEKSADNNKFKMPSWSTVWKNTVECFFTSITIAKVMGVGAFAAYLLVNGISKTDVIYMGLGAVLAGYAIVVFVTTAHFATKSRRAQ